MIDKAYIRKQIIKQREVLTLGQRLAKAEKITNHLLSNPLFEQARHIACYWSIKAEVTTQQIIGHIWRQGKCCYLPSIDEQTKTMQFARYDSSTHLIYNRFGIAEPAANSAILIPPQALDIVLLPLVAFDKQGNRLGMGAGYYDRVFAFKHQAGMKPWLLGLAYDLQQVDHLPHEPWDVKLDGVATESGCSFYKRLINKELP